MLDGTIPVCSDAFVIFVKMGGECLARVFHQGCGDWVKLALLDGICED